MTLRLRLVGALGVLLAVGLAAFGLATYQFYARSQYDRLDDQLLASLPFLEYDLNRDEDQDQERNGPGGPSGNPRPPVGLPTGTYAELRDPTWAVVDSLQLAETGTRPAIPDELPAPGHFDTVGSVEGDGRWRLTSAFAGRPRGHVVVAAVPTSDVTASLRRLLAVEVVVGVVLLSILTAGSWLILRRGLRPLEHMAASAGRINAGALSERVEPADDRSEVGQLGLALNTMLDEIEAAFRQRDATEQRLRQFLADASHELRTPLTSIQGFAELFRLEQVPDHVSLEVILRRIEEESARMKHLVEDLLLLARLDETRPLDPTSVDLAVLAADACSDAVAQDPDRPVTLDAPEPVVVLDATCRRRSRPRLAAARILEEPADDRRRGRSVDRVRYRREQAVLHLPSRRKRAARHGVRTLRQPLHAGGARRHRAPGGYAAFQDPSRRMG
jgi:two-component system, OmpR family, sensor kinase